MSYYQKHVFFCTTQREPGNICCGNHKAEEMVMHARERIKSLELDGKGKIRINKAGCLGRCHEGPVIVVYPEEVWYSYNSQADIDEIIDEHLLSNRVVERLKI